MNIIDSYLQLADEGRFEEGLPLIEEILHRDESIDTSWFNYGICLAELGRHKEAASAFLKAYELNPEDGGALYRGCLALAAAPDSTRLFEVFKSECERDPGMMVHFQEESAFDKFFRLPRFQDLREQYGRQATQSPPQGQRSKPWWKFW